MGDPASVDLSHKPQHLHAARMRLLQPLTVLLEQRRPNARDSADDPHAHFRLACEQHVMVDADGGQVGNAVNGHIDRSFVRRDQN